jgi:hypothetical protein
MPRKRLPGSSPRRPSILIDRPALEAFHADLVTKQREQLQRMQGCVPESLRVLTHETGREPEPGVLHPEARTHTLRGVEKVEAPEVRVMTWVSEDEEKGTPETE